MQVARVHACGAFGELIVDDIFRDDVCVRGWWQVRGYFLLGCEVCHFTGGVGQIRIGQRAASRMLHRNARLGSCVERVQLAAHQEFDASAQHEICDICT